MIGSAAVSESFRLHFMLKISFIFDSRKSINTDISIATSSVEVYKFLVLLMEDIALDYNLRQPPQLLRKLVRLTPL